MSVCEEEEGAERTPVQRTLRTDHRRSAEAGWDLNGRWITQATVVLRVCGYHRTREKRRWSGEPTRILGVFSFALG